MIDISITSNSTIFYSDVAKSVINSELLEPKWTKNDDLCFALYTSEGIYCINVNYFSLNGVIFNNSDDAISYLDNL